MKEYYLRVEGVNLSSVLEDTAQLSVVRGGSLLLRNVIKDITKKWGEKWKGKLEPISTGASMGLFRICSDKPEDLCNQLATDLTLDPKFQHFTFVVDIQPGLKGDFRKTQEAITARSRFRQLQQLSLALPPSNQSQSEPCKVDDLRPGDGRIKIRRTTGIERPPVSRSVQERHNFGRRRKWKFYEEEITENGGVAPEIKALRFSNELNEIAASTRFDNLKNKLAVVYFDGNGFGSIQREHCKDAKALIRFDETVQGYRRTFLKTFLLKISQDRDFKTDDNRLQLETLLWGGDEITLVVPAWKGFWTLNYFYEQSKDWTYPIDDRNGIPLTHAGGLVFCHYKTPIVRTKKLAKDLADQVKDYLLGKERRNLFEYEVLESIDFPTEPVGTFWNRRFGALACCRQPLPPIPDWDKVKPELEKLLKDIPKGQVYELANKGVKNPDAGFQEQRKRFMEVIRKDRFRILEEVVKRLFPNAACEVWPWVHLLELWDYLALDLEEPAHA